MSAHRTPEEIRKHLKHPVIDGDGHWVEYTPVFGERMRKAVRRCQTAATGETWEGRMP